MSDKYKEGILLFKAEDHNLLYDNIKRETSRKRIEIFPYHRKEFDLISFVDFAIATCYQYYVDRIITRKDKSASVKVYHSENIAKNMKLFKQALKCKTFKEMKEIVLKANDEDAHDSQIEIENDDGFHEDENDREKNDEEPEEDINEQEEYEKETENKKVRKNMHFSFFLTMGFHQ